MGKNKKLYSLIFVALLTLSAYFLADTVDTMIGRSLDAAPTYANPIQSAKTGIQPRRELSDYTSILDRGLFGDGKGPSAAPAAAVVNYRLIGTVEGEAFSGAVLEDTTGQAFYRTQQKLPDGSRIVKVIHDKITIKRADGTLSDLQVVDDAKIVNVTNPAGNSSTVKKLGDSKFAVDQREVASNLENMNQLLTQARALPYVEQGKTVGFRISEIVPGSLYDKIGLQNGDVIQKINSQDVDDPAKFFQMYQNLKEERNISIDVLRGGQRQTMTYDIR